MDKSCRLNDEMFPGSTYGKDVSAFLRRRETRMPGKIKDNSFKKSVHMISTLLQRDFSFEQCFTTNFMFS